MSKAISKQEKDPLNFVHQNAILCETITKEQRHQKLYTNYSVNPFKKSEFWKAMPDGEVLTGRVDNRSLLECITRSGYTSLM